MQYQAPVAGEVLNDALADTVLDKVLHPFPRKADKLEAAAAVLALPILVAVVERNPEMAGPLELPLRAAVQAHLVAMAPAMKRQQAKDKKVAEAAASLGLDKGPDGETLGDPVGVILDAILRLDDQPAGPQAAPEPAPAHVA
jgi:hypothetical protein